MLNSFSCIRQNLWKYKGGRVVLEKNQNTGIALILLDRPEKCNAITGKMMVDLRECIEDLENWKEGKGLILTGKGNHFSSGGDLNFEKLASRQDGLDLSVWMHNSLSRLQKLPLVSVCLMHGFSLGGASEIALFCDFIVAADNVTYGLVHGKAGLSPSCGSGLRLVQKVGYRKALDILLASKVMNAKECVDVGLVDHVISSPVQISEAINWLQTRLSLKSEMVRAFKTIVSNTQLYNYEDVIRMERDFFLHFWTEKMKRFKTI